MACTESKFWSYNLHSKVKFTPQGQACVVSGILLQQCVLIYTIDIFKIGYTMTVLVTDKVLISELYFFSPFKLVLHLLR